MWVWRPVSALLIARVLLVAWSQYRTDRLLLPLATVTAVLFFGQAFVGAMQVARGFPEHLRGAACLDRGLPVGLFSPHLCSRRGVHCRTRPCCLR